MLYIALQNQNQTKQKQHPESTTVSYSCNAQKQEAPSIHEAFTLQIHRQSPLPSFLPSHASSELFSSAAAAAAASKMFANLIMCTKTGREGKGESETTKNFVMMNRRKKLLQSARKIRWSKAKFFPLFSLSSLFLFAPPFLFRSPPGIPTARTPASSRTNARRLSSTRVVPPKLFQKPT